MFENAWKLAVRFDMAMFSKRSRKGNGHSGSKMLPHYNMSSTVPMELDATETAQRLQKSEKSKNKACYTCGKEGHFARDCRSKLKPKIANIEEVKEDKDTPTLTHLVNVSDNKETLLYFHGWINRKLAWILLDSGASRNFVNETFVEKNDLK